MRTTKKQFLAVASVFAFTLFPNALQADSRVQSETFDSSDFSFSFSGVTSTNYGATFSFNVDQFNPSLGTLDGVSVSYSFVVDTQVTLGSTSGGATFSGGGSFVWDANSFYGTGGGAGNGGGPFSTITLSYNISGTVTPGGDNGLTLDMVKGTGTSVLSFQPGFSVSVPDGASASGALTSGSLSITYDYTPVAVPEPATLGLATLAAGLVLLRFRRS